MKQQVTAILLAGGKSSRMGTDKGFLKLNNKSFTQHIIDSVSPLVNEIIIVSDNPKYNLFNKKRIEDVIKNSGPLSGLYSGLKESTTELHLVLSCDIPLINTSLLKILITSITETDDMIQYAYQNKTMPLIALYKKRCLYKCLTLLKSGEKRLTSLSKQVQCNTISVDEKLNKRLVNINTQKEFKQLCYDVNH